MNKRSDNNPEHETPEPPATPANAGADTASSEKPGSADRHAAGSLVASEVSQSRASRRWMIGIAVVIALIWLAAVWNKKAVSSAESSSPATNQTSAAGQSPASDSPQQTARFTEEPPAVGGKEIFSMPQLRYCLAENIRLDAGKEIVNSHNRADVDRFNVLTADYNERCINLRFRRGSFERAKAEVEQYRPLIEAEGRARFSKKVAASASAAKAGAASPTAPTIAAGPTAPAKKAAAAAPTAPARSAVAAAPAAPAAKAAAAVPAAPKPKAQPAEPPARVAAKAVQPELPLAKEIARVRSACSPSVPCKGAALCVNGQCRALSRSGEQCASSRECAGSNHCLDGQCRPLRVTGERCEASFECGGLNECVEGRCQMPQ